MHLGHYAKCLNISLKSVMLNVSYWAQMKMQGQQSSLKTLLFGARPKSVGLCHWFYLYVMPGAQDMSWAQPEKWQDLIAWFSPHLMPWCVSQTIISASFALLPFRNFPLSLQVAVVVLNRLQRSPFYGFEIHIRPTVVYCSLLCWFTHVSAIIEAATEVMHRSDWWHLQDKCDVWVCRVENLKISS